jgi:hypothetical protein
MPRTTTQSSSRKRTKKPRSTGTNGASFTARVETIGPKKAKKYLDTMGRNRRKRGRLKERYKEAMAGGQWKLTGESIKFNTKGELIDGQHRLEAVIETGKEIQILVCRNVPDEAFMELDTGGVRTPGDLLTVAGYDYTSGVASAIRNLTSIYEIEAGKIKGGSLGRRRVDPETLLEYAEEHSDDLVAAVKKTMSTEAKVVCGPPSLFAALYFIFAEHNKKAADEFFDSLIDGTNLQKHRPVYELRRLLLQFAADKHKKRPAFYKAAITIKAWNAFQNRMEVRSLRYSENEEWPEIERRKSRVTPEVAKKRAKKAARDEKIAKRERVRRARKKAKDAHKSKAARKGVETKQAKKKAAKKKAVKKAPRKAPKKRTKKTAKKKGRARK